MLSKKTNWPMTLGHKEREVLGRTTSPLVSLAKASSSVLLRAPSIVFCCLMHKKKKEGTLALSCCVTKHLDGQAKKKTRAISTGSGKRYLYLHHSAQRWPI